MVSWSLSGNCLKDIQLYVPEAVADGDTVTLSCQYDLENVSAGHVNIVYLV